MGGGAAKPIHLLFAPPLVWAVAGLLLLGDGARALDYFQYLWVANDLSIMLAFAGVLLTLFRGAAPEAPPVDEWTGWRAEPAEDLPLEEMLVALARELGREAPAR